jgi:hypothetical protein
MVYNRDHPAGQMTVASVSGDTIPRFLAVRAIARSLADATGAPGASREHVGLQPRPFLPIALLASGRRPVGGAAVAA